MGCAALTLLGGGNRNFLSGASLFTVGSGLAAATGLDWDHGLAEDGLGCGDDGAVCCYNRLQRGSSMLDMHMCKKYRD